MQNEAIALGTAFSDWAQLTEEYAKGMDGLRRREPGASARMMEIAKLMSRYQQLMGCPEVATVPASRQPSASMPQRGGWMKSTAQMLFGTRHSAGLRLSH